MKIAVLTCNIGDNSNIKKIKHKEENVDYLYITDSKVTINQNQNSGYKFIYTDAKYEDDEVCPKSRKLAKRIKIKYNEFISGYDWVVWVDGQNQIEKSADSLRNYISKIPDNIDIAFKPHPKRSNVFEEIDECKALFCENPITAEEWRGRLTSEKFEQVQHTLSETNIIFFRYLPRNIPKQFYDDWWFYSTNYLRRDQLTLNYFIWKHNIKDYVIMDPKIPNSFPLPS